MSVQQAQQHEEQPVVQVLPVLLYEQAQRVQEDGVDLGQGGGSEEGVRCEGEGVRV